MCTPGAKASVGSVAAKTSTNFRGGWFVIRCPPHLSQYLRSLNGVFLNVETRPFPAVMRTESGFQSVKALTGPPDQLRHDRQWQYPIPSGSPTASTRTIPQKHCPLCVVAALSLAARKRLQNPRMKYLPQKDRLAHGIRSSPNEAVSQNCRLLPTDPCWSRSVPACCHRPAARAARQPDEPDHRERQPA